MKKNFLLILLAGFFMLASCSSNDDDDDTTEGNVVATWELTAVKPPVLDLSECPTNPTITFENDNTAEWTFYDAENDCEGRTEIGNWEQDSGSAYALTIPGYGSFNGKVEFQNENEFTFKTAYQNFPVVLYFEK